MEAEDWTHPDISLPQLLSLVRAFVEMLLLASGFQPSASPAFWRTQECQRALGWASLLEQIIAKIPVEEEDKGVRETLNKVLQTLMLETFYPEGLPKLSCEILGEAKELFTHAMCHALGSHTGQIESLVAASYRNETDQEIVFQHLRQRFMVVESTKAITKALELAASLPNRRDAICGCEQWRQEALTYLLDARTLYKISGASVLFKCSEMQWKVVLQRVKDQADINKSVEIAELCCLYMSQTKQSVLITKLLKPCDRMACSIEALKCWHSADQTMEGLMSKETDPVAALLYELALSDKRIWWSLPPILVAAALTKGSLLFGHYTRQLSGHIDSGNEAESSYRCAGETLQARSSLIQNYNPISRSWCVQFVSCIDALKDDIEGS